jgi:hypothetical protein
MTWEAIAALGSLLSALVIAVSATFALRQVNQLRRAAQLDGTLRIFAEFSDPEFIAARNFVFSQLPHKMQDETFLEELRSYKYVDTAKHPEYKVLLFLQLVGTLVQNNLVDGPGIYQFAQYSIIKSWHMLEPVVRMQRVSTNNPFMWGGADFLYANAKRWVEEQARVRNITNPATGQPFTVDQLT